MFKGTLFLCLKRDGVNLISEYNVFWIINPDVALPYLVDLVVRLFDIDHNILIEHISIIPFAKWEVVDRDGDRGVVLILN